MGEPRYSKRDVLQTLLDTSKLATDLLDRVDAEQVVIDREMVMRVTNLTARLVAMRESFVAEYVLRGSAADDLLSDVRASLGGTASGRPT